MGLFSDLGSGNKKKSENDWSIKKRFFSIPPRTNSKTSKVNQQSVLNL